MNSSAANAVIVVGGARRRLGRRTPTDRSRRADGRAGSPQSSRRPRSHRDRSALACADRTRGGVHSWPTRRDWDIIRAAGSAAYEIEGEQWRRAADGLERADEQWESMTAALERLENIGESDLSFADFLATRAADLPASVKTLASRYIEGFDAADLDLISAQSPVGKPNVPPVRSKGIACSDWWTATAGCSNGFGPPPTSGCSMFVSARSFRQSPGGRAMSEHQRCSQRRARALSSWRARCAVITLPLGVLQAPPGSLGAVRFSPELPEKQAALGQLEDWARCVKVILRFDESFWERGQLDRASFSPCAR